MARRAAGEKPDDRDQGEAALAPAETRAAASSGSRLPSRIGDYRIVRRLGAGGMGVVYEAEQQHPRRAVALKVVRGGRYVDEHILRLLRREAQTLARLRHPGIAAIYESGCTEGGEHFFAMELVRGETLGDYLRRRPPREKLPEAEIRHRLALYLRICEAVSYAHQRGVIHRDLKPSNILVARPEAAPAAGDTPPPAPEIKILDFGIARITDADVAATVVTEIGQVQGTLAYVSPEQVRGNPDVRRPRPPRPRPSHLRRRAATPASHLRQVRRADRRPPHLRSPRLPRSAPHPHPAPGGAHGPLLWRLRQPNSGPVAAARSGALGGARARRRRRRAATRGGARSAP